MTSLEQKAFSGVTTFLFAFAVIIFLPAWTFNYWQGWIYLIIFSLSVIIITAYFLKVDPDLIIRRLHGGPAAEKEKIQQVIQVFASVCLIATMTGAGLDHRYGWSSVSLPINILSEIFVSLGFFIIFLVFKENSFASATVDVERTQKVITTGPYKFVRHPMYAGATVLFIATPLALGSYWSLIPAIFLILTMIVRLLHEEKLLLNQLPGYKDYCKKTRYHLIPFIW